MSYKIKFPTEVRKMWSGGEVQAWLDRLPPLQLVEKSPVHDVMYEGHKAHDNGLLKIHNPYAKASEDYYSWNIGYEQAELWCINYRGRGFINTSEDLE